MPIRLRRNSDTTSLVVDTVTLYLARNLASIHVLELDADGTVSNGRDIDGLTPTDLGIATLGDMTGAIIEAFVASLVAGADVAVALATPPAPPDPETGV